MSDTNHTWSPMQLAVFEDFETGIGHTVVQARAGSGKTTTVMEGVRLVPARRGRDWTRILMCAFNKSIRDELKRRAPKRVDVRTLHGAGLVATQRAFGSEVDEQKAARVIERVMTERGQTIQGRDGVRRAFGVGKVRKLVEVAKGTLTPEEDRDALLDLVVEFELDDDPKLPGQLLAEVASQVMAETAADRATIDFPDMVWFPWRHGLRPATHDLVVVDETQDLNAAQLHLVRGLTRRGGRIVAVGDDRQAIYGFRGADSRAMSRMIQELEAKVLPLSISYRCPRRVVELAREYCPDLEAAPNAAEGSVEYVGPEAMLREARPGDFVISRANAPLARYCLAFLGRGIPACIAGKDIGRNLTDLCHRSEAHTTVELAQWLARWSALEYERYQALDKSDKAAEVMDRAAALSALSEGLHTVGQVVDRIESLFSDADPRSRIVLTTTHKAKGLERPVVWMLRDTYHPGRDQEEANLYYVAVTRAQRDLRMVTEER